VSGAPSVPVAVIARPGADYPLLPPFSPPNPVYEMVEAALRALGLDHGRAGTPEWNPLGAVIAPGDRVVIKPNFVASKNFHQVMQGELLACSSTHGSVLRPLIDYALRAAGPRGTVTIVDTPVEGCNIKQVLSGLGIDALLRYYSERGQRIEFYDLRKFQVVPRMLLDNVRRHERSWNLGLLVRQELPGDPRGSQVVDRGPRSRFAEVEQRASRYRFHRSHLYTPVPHHSGGRHEYSLPRTVLEADAILNVAKMKTHKKSGVTMALKAVIGLCNEKYWLPHYTAGTTAEDGDEFPLRPPLWVRIENQLQRFPLPGDHSLIARAPRLQRPQNGLLQDYIVEGSWEGNDTIWRTTLDLHDLVLHTDRSGRLHDTPQRRCLSFVDGIIAGEGEGPLAATPRHAGLLCAAEDPVLLDLCCTRLMGFAPERVPTVWQALQRPLLATSRAELLREVIDGPLPPAAFLPPSTWPSLRAKSQPER
jgi:uncharacterized protein (DUF362 family)